MDEFTDKVALITGGGRGTGREIALALASLGVAVAVNDINPLNLEETVSQITKVKGRARPYIFDIAKRMPIEGMITQVLADFNHIDILVNHASVHPDASLLEMDEWEFHRTIDVNLGGPFFCMQQVGRVMREQGEGVIVNLISLQHQNFHKGHGAHSASQAALAGLTQAAADELAPDHIRVNAVCYGSRLQDNIVIAELDTTGLHAWYDQHPQIHVADHPDLVTKVVYLCSSASASLNGRIIAAQMDE
jgi:NAD(P)-dependent dehydrogenase (short-subunit alcohol dehydrogenase family)